MEKLTITNWTDRDRQDYVGGVILQRDETKKLEINFCGNGDLYFLLNVLEGEPTFIIGKDNYQVYEIIDRLYNDIINAQIYEPLSDLEINEIIDECEWYEEDYHLILAEKEKWYQKCVEMHKKKALTSGLVKNGVITWRSDDFAHDVAPYFKLAKLKNSYVLEFGKPNIQRKLNDEEYFYIKKCDYGTHNIRLRNSGSSYDPFNIIFMRAFQALKEITTDMLQIHIEEYLIDKKLASGMTLERILKQ